jgi:signal transduction histidine kinase
MRIACLLLYLAVAGPPAAEALAAEPGPGQQAAPQQMVPQRAASPKQTASRQQIAFDRAIMDAKSAMMAADPQGALGTIDVALQRAAALPPRDAAIGRATALWLKTEANIGLNRLTEAGALLEQALPLAERNAPNTKLHGDLMRSRAGVAGLRGQVQHALRDYLAAHRIFRAAGEARSQAITLQDIGQLYWEAGDYERMLRYYQQAQELYDDDPGFSLSTHNNRAEALRMLGRREEAEREFISALAYARQLGSSLLEMRILGNLAMTQSELGKFGDAQRNAERALRLSTGAEAEDWRPLIYFTLATIAAARGDDREAAANLERTFAKRDLSKTEITYKPIHELAAKVHERLGRTALALAHLQAFQRLDSEARDLTASASSQLLAARFDFANQNLRIAQLKQGQLERDVQMERQRVTYRTTLFSALAVAGAIVLALVTFAFFSIRRSRNEVRAANTVLTEVNVQLEKALKAKTDFLAMTSHEIRTPLNGILGMTQVMLASPKLVGEEREQVQLVYGAGQTMRALVDDILDVAKMETGEVSVDLAPTRLRPILEDAIALWQGGAKNKGLLLEAQLDDAPRWIETDGGKVRQVVFNLLSNAIKFTAQGSVRLTATCDRAADTLRLCVEDTGIGIPQEEQAQIFEAFHQVDSAMTRQFSGTGLGLAICRNFATALGGTIALESEQGKGSRFTITLPLREVAELEHQRAGTLAEVRLGVLEGNEMKRGMVKGLVAPHVRSAIDTANGTAALDQLAAGAVDHLLIDAASATVAGQDRLVALAQIIDRAGEEGVLTTVLLSPDEQLTAEAVAALQPTHLLLKPVKGGELMRTLRGAYQPAGEIVLSQVA